MAVDFPSSPTVGQTYTSGGLTWTWDGAKWVNSGAGSGSIFLPLSGGTISGNLTVTGATALNGASTAPTVATADNSTNIATTAFVKTALPAPSTTAPVMDGTAAVGVSALFARGDHVHPTDTSRAAQSSLASYLPLAGGSMTGGLTANVGVYAPGSSGVNDGNFSVVNGSGAAGWSASSFQFATASGVGYANLCRSDSTSAYLHYYLAGGNNVGNIYTNGSTTAYNTTSDRSMKDNIRDLISDIDVGDIIDRIRPVAFEWKPPAPQFDVVARTAPPSNTGHGFVAQELYEVVPMAVTPPLPIGPGKRHEDDGPHLWGADFSKLVPYLVAEVQALRKRVAELEAK